MSQSLSYPPKHATAYEDDDLTPSSSNNNLISPPAVPVSTPITPETFFSSWLRRIPGICIFGVIPLFMFGPQYAPWFFTFSVCFMSAIFLFHQCTQLIGVYCAMVGIKECARTDWRQWAIREKAVRKAQQIGNPAAPEMDDVQFDHVQHIILIPNYKEDDHTLVSTLDNLAAHPDAQSSYRVVLAMEEREQGSEAKALRMVNSFARHFLHITYTLHPPNIPGEAAGKSSNLAWASRDITKRYAAGEAGVDAFAGLNNMIVTVIDSDSCFAADWFAAITAKFVCSTVEDRARTMFVAPIVFDRNASNVPAPVRVTDMIWSMAGLSSIYPFSSIKIPTSAYGVTMSLVTKVGFWDAGADSIGEDMHMYLKCLFGTHGHLISHTIYSPASQSDVVSGAHEPNKFTWRSYTSDLHARYTQALRHMFGALDTGYYWRRLLTMDFGPEEYAAAFVREHASHGPTGHAQAEVSRVQTQQHQQQQLGHQHQQHQQHARLISIDGLPPAAGPSNLFSPIPLQAATPEILYDPESDEERHSDELAHDDDDNVSVGPARSNTSSIAPPSLVSETSSMMSADSPAPGSFMMDGPPRTPRDFERIAGGPSFSAWPSAGKAIQMPMLRMNGGGFRFPSFHVPSYSRSSISAGAGASAEIAAAQAQAQTMGLSSHARKLLAASAQAKHAAAGGDTSKMGIRWWIVYNLFIRLYEAHMMLVHVTILSVLIVVLDPTATLSAIPLLGGTLSTAEWAPASFSATIELDFSLADMLWIAAVARNMAVPMTLLSLTFFDRFHNYAAQGRWVDPLCYNTVPAAPSASAKGKGVAGRHSRSRSSGEMHSYCRLGSRSDEVSLRPFPWAMLDWIAIPTGLVYGFVPLAHAQLIQLFTDRLDYRTSAKPKPKTMVEAATAMA